MSLILYPCGHLDDLYRLYVETCSSVLCGHMWACFLFYLDTWGPLSCLSGHPGVIIVFVWTPRICLCLYGQMKISTISILSTQTLGSQSLSSLCGCRVINVSTGTPGSHYALYVDAWESTVISTLTPGSHHLLHGHQGVNFHHFYIDTWVSWPSLCGPLGVIMVSMCTSGSHIGSTWTPGSH